MGSLGPGEGCENKREAGRRNVSAQDGGSALQQEPPQGEAEVPDPPTEVTLGAG